MKDYRIYLFPPVWLFFLGISIYLILINWILGIIFFVLLFITVITSLITYIYYLLWPIHKWIDTSQIEFEEVDIPSSTDGLYLKGLLLRRKASKLDTNKKVGIIFHHGYNGTKEKTYRFTIPLAFHGYTVLAYDARGHGKSQHELFNKLDIAGIISDVKHAIDFFEGLDDTDNNHLIMMGHSLGAITTLTTGYQDKRIKKLVAISGMYDLGAILQTKLRPYNRFRFKVLKKKIIKELDMSMEELNKVMSPKFYLEEEQDILDEDRVYLVHGVNDTLPFTESKKIVDKLNLPKENYLFLEKPESKYLTSPHNLTGQDSIIISFMLRVINS
jgi:pimeloyl-ACP methyl ester carboxylesterase